MGASEWRYVVPYQPDLARALSELRDEVFARGDYYRASGVDTTDDGRDRPPPQTIEELWADEVIRESGTHSVLDMFAIAAPEETDQPRPGTIAVTSDEEAEFITGTTHPTHDDVDELVEQLTAGRWTGRCAVLYEGEEPHKILFWGISGD